MGLENLKSIFKDGFIEQVEEYTSNKPIDVSDTKLTQQPRPILDSLLRGREYEKIRFSQNFENNNLFVKPETGEVQESLFRTQTFDPRAPFAKEGTLYFNINNSFNPATNPTDFSTAGNNQGPYTPLTELGGQFKEFLSWENLYNSNHSPKDNPLYKGISAINYGANVNRDMLDINYNIGGDGGQSALHYGEKTGIVGGFSRRGLSGNGEPYRVTKIGDRDSNRGSQFSPLRRALNDGDRIIQYLTSAEGAAFILRQNSNSIIENTVYRQKGGDDEDDKLIRTPQRFANLYNPLSTIAASSGRLLGMGPNAFIKRAGGGEISDTLRGWEGLVHGEEIADFLDSLTSEYGVNSTVGGFSINDSFTKAGDNQAGTGKGFFSQIGGFTKNQITDAISTLNPFEGTEIPKDITGDKMTLSAMIKGPKLTSGNTLTVTDADTGEVLAERSWEFGAGDSTDTAPFGGVVDTTHDGQELGVDAEAEENGMPFYFKDLRDNTYIFFRAYIEGLTENISPSYSAHNYVGRSEPVYTYERGEREISMTLKLVAQTKGELKSIYKKMDRLTSMCYPAYVGDDYGNRMKPPLAKLRYGELFGSMNKELMGYIKSLSYSVEQSSTYETDPKTGRVPRHINVTLAYQVIHDNTPSISTRFYGINQLVSD